MPASSEESGPLIRFLPVGVPGVVDEGRSTNDEMRDSMSSRLVALEFRGDGATSYLSISAAQREASGVCLTSEASRLCLFEVNSFCRNSRCRLSSASLAFFASISSFLACIDDIVAPGLGRWSSKGDVVFSVDSRARVWSP